MSQAHYIKPTAPSRDFVAVRLGGAATQFNYADLGKLVKLAAESQFDLCAAGDPIEAVVANVSDPSTAGGFFVGAIDDADRIYAIADGLQATPGTGTLAVGDYVCAGTITARNTAFAANTPFPKVCKSTVQIGVTPADLAGAGRQSALLAAGAWRVLSLGPAGTGAVGTVVVIAPVGKKI